MTAAVEVEQQRLESIVSLVFDEGRHYHHTCKCASCANTRKYLNAEDLRFINHISSTVRDPSATPAVS